jgi:hypothetical protein
MIKSRKKTKINEGDTSYEQLLKDWNDELKQIINERNYKNRVTG